jgi:hypothetical protein
MTEGRLERAVERITAPYSKTPPDFLTLSPGERILISGQNDSYVMFLGMKDGALLYRAHSGHEFLRPLKRVSFGWRYDIYSAGYWTREMVEATIPRQLVTNFKSEGVSRVQSAEIVVFDKKARQAYPMWVSLGLNRDRIGEAEAPAHKTLPAPGSSTIQDGSGHRASWIMKPEHKPEPAQQPETVCILAVDEAMRLATEVYRKKTLKYPISDVKMVVGSLILNVAGQGVLISRDGDTIRARYKENDRQREATISPEIIKKDQGNYVNYGGSHYHIVFTVFNLKTRKNEEHSEALVFASIYTWDNRHYGTFAYGAA